jgi:hypothetical protein
MADELDLPPLPPDFESRVNGAAGRPASQDKAYRLAWADAQRTHINQKFGPSSDPTNSHWISKYDLGNSAQIFWGRVVDVIPYVNAYKVQPEHGMTTILCTGLSHTGVQPTGVKEYGHIPPGAGVYFILHQDSTFGLIVAVEPEFATSAQAAISDFVSQAGRSGLSVDTAHKAPFQLNDNGTVIDWSSGRPFDTTTAGEHGHISTLGLAKHIDDFMAFLRADEETGIWGFFHDSMLRVAGHNLQLWSHCREREDLDDENEIISVEQYATYAEEGLGLFQLANPFRDLSADGWQMDPAQQAYSAVEPLFNDQQGFFRLRDFYGYLGQAHKRVLQLPPQPIPTQPQTYSTELQCPGVYEENLSLTGRKSIRTAHEYMVVKRLPIPSPKAMKPPADANGDNSTNYMAAGRWGVGPQHAVVGQLQGPQGPQAPDVALVHAMGFLDKQEFVFNWEGVHPFYYHKEDWYLPNEASLAYLPAMSPPDFGSLTTRTHMGTPAPVPLTVDHRYRSVPYYPTTSYWGLLEDGGIVHGDAWGTEFKTHNGNGYLDTPGNLYLRAGRNVVIEAGKDVIIKAKYSFDISATLNDGRLKAEHGLYVLGGNDGCGGILLESKANAPALDFLGKQGEDVTLGGIILKAPNSMVATCSGLQIFTTPQGPQAPQNPGFLVNMAKGRVRVFADFFERFMTSAAIDAFVQGDPGTASVVDVPASMGPQALAVGPKAGMSAGASGLDVTVPELMAMEAGAGYMVTPPQQGQAQPQQGIQLNAGFDGSDMPQEGVGQFGGPAVGQVNEYWGGRTTMAGAVRVNGEIVSTDCIYANGDFCSAYGHFFSTRANLGAGRVTTLKGDTLAAVQQSVSYTQSRSAYLEGLGNQELTAMFAYPIMHVCAAEFSYRNVVQYKTDDWTVPEPRWHQLNRAALAVGTGTTNKWTEKAVFTATGSPTYPYPGYEPWTQRQSLLTLDTDLLDLADSLGFDRGNLYEDPAYPTVNGLVPDGNYPTIF